MKFIPVCEPTIIGNEKKYVNDCIDTNWISSNGKYIEQFENKFSEFCETKYGVGCANGTVAIHLALEALGIGEGDEVILPTFTMIGSCNPIIYSGAKPVFVDAEMKTWNIDPTKIEEKITNKTKAIMVVHIYGHPCDMEPIIQIAKKHKLILIEDAAEAHGALYKGKKIGSLGDVATFSFYANKIITTGEGGMIVTNNLEIAEKSKLLRNHGFGKQRFVHYELGFNYRITNIQSAIGLAQTENVDKLIEMRIKNAQLYNQYLQGITGLVLPPQEEWAKNVYWMYGLLLPKGINRDLFMDKLKERGIETRAFFKPMHQQPVYINKKTKKNNYPDCNGKYPVADELWERGLYLPSSSHLKEDEIKYVCDNVKQLIEKK